MLPTHLTYTFLHFTYFYISSYTYNIYYPPGFLLVNIYDFFLKVRDLMNLSSVMFLFLKVDMPDSGLTDVPKPVANSMCSQLCMIN